ncbi:MAG: PspC domain-containing protein [Chloroflexota bacterium]|nr:MAG: PspC domain-containing protein [Chloroflexota bacterium]
MSNDTKKLYRSTDDRWLAGVCGGLGSYFNVDPTLVRVIFIVLALIGLGGVILYLILWVVIPPEPTDEELAIMDHVIEQEIAEEKAESAGEEEAE